MDPFHPARRPLAWLPSLLLASVILAMLAHGPISQWPDYHRFADVSRFLGMPHAADVLSNAGFALIALWGWRRLSPRRREAELAPAWPGYRLFLAALLLTACGSAFYHLAPDNSRLVWDRLPIALACAGLLAAVRAECVPGADAGRDCLWLSLAAAASVGWWQVTEGFGAGDLRPYLLLQAAPMLLISLWQGIYRAPRGDRWLAGAALLLYALAKLTEMHDHELLQATGMVSGHTLKHLFASAAAAVLVYRPLRGLSRTAAESTLPCSGRADAAHNDGVKTLL
ncbi:hypothetical protein SAMN06265795_11618 [Noviherbaspirillum humi]|uniref:Ceramidase n=1 Tax=Noviherbaspirillum humi TaxID=1688639 RepID=A0A239KLE9_9BURK|nr:hypothetical protein [Noviherbaspirillum humi]SNT18004.1 hypothetical protein SAMN06265795_11618 [Noviherbaspirillum humi]